MVGNGDDFYVRSGSGLTATYMLSEEGIAGQGNFTADPLFADSLNGKGRRFMISYIIENNGKVNERLKSWIKEKGYRIIRMKDIPGISRKEVLIVNYD